MNAVGELAQFADHQAQLRACRFEGRRCGLVRPARAVACDPEPHGQRGEAL
jgi:hypothetical protein